MEEVKEKNEEIVVQNRLLFISLTKNEELNEGIRGELEKSFRDQGLELKNMNPNPETGEILVTIPISDESREKILRALSWFVVGFRPGPLSVTFPPGNGGAPYTLTLE